MVVGAGCHFHVTQDYMSRIRGGRNSQAIRIGSDPVRAAREEADILLAINPDHLPHFLPGVAKGGFAIADVPTAAPPLIAAPLKEMAAMAGSPILANVAGAGAIAHALGIPPETADPVFAADFKGDFFEKNRAVFRLGAEWAREHLPEEIGKRFRLPARLPVPRIILSGNEALALGALAGGCKFASGYPMTPGTSILAVLADEGPSLGLVFEQAEDEIAALNMAIGASYAGARSLVSTSGGGFALMTEAVSLAGMMETPVVVVLAMRPGPATGMPTRTLGILPVRRHIVRGNSVSRTPEGRYLRHAYTESGISPMAVPGEQGITVVVDSDEHTEDGHITEDHETRIRMVAKRLRKGAELARRILPPLVSGPPNGDALLVGFGSTKEVNEEARRILAREGRSVAVVHLRQVWPFPSEEIAGIVPRYGVALTVENNATGQLARLIQRESGVKMDGTISRFDGLPFTAERIAAEARKRIWTGNSIPT
jgi:2-oxoglutarate ferredoxin oxidoreductase subunit alpha